MPARLWFCPGGAGLFVLLLTLFGVCAQSLPAMGAGARPWLIVDIDADRLPDLVEGQMTVLDGQWQISAIHMERDLRQLPVGRSPIQPLRLHPRDVDADSDLDLIVYHDFGRRAVGLWINDGQGHFSRGDVSTLPPEPDRHRPMTNPQAVPSPTSAVHGGRRVTPGLVLISRASPGIVAGRSPDGFNREQSRRRRRPQLATAGRSPPHI